MNVKKYLLLILILLTVFVISSCTTPKPENNSEEQNGGANGGSGDEAPPEPEEPIDDGSIYSELTTPIIVYSSGGVSTESLNKICERIYWHTDKMPQIRLSDGLATTNHEIVVGKTERKISDRAYTLMDRLEREASTDVRYLVYTDGSSVAIAYDMDVFDLGMAEKEAVSRFIDEVCLTEELFLNAGVLLSGSFSIIERQEEADSVKTESAWAEARRQFTELYGKEFSDEAIAALEKLYSLYTDGAVSWIANLYDYGTGGFYYSNSARNTEGFLPDLESTYQAIALMSSTGMLGNYGTDTVSGLPDWFGERVVYFVKGLQDSENGYFYHPQWTKALSNSNLARLGRDLTHATRLLSMYGASPTYDTPNGVKGDGISVTDFEVVAASALSHKLSASKAVMVSKVVLANGSDSVTPSHMRSESAFRKYLSGLDINSNPYYIGNQLESQANQIVARDEYLEEIGESYRLSDILESWLNDHQYKSSGLWSRGEVDYEAINALLKISSTYSRIGKPVPNAAKGLSNAIKVLTSEDPIRHVCDILNPWYAIAILTDNIKTYSSDSSELEAVMAELVENYSAAVLATAERLAILYREDGSFGYLPDSSSPTSQNMPVAVPGTLEGDVNATYIAISSISQHIFNAVGVDFILPYSEADRLLLISILDEVGDVIKDPVSPPEPITFEYDDVGQESAEIDSIQINSSGSIKVVKDPSGKANKVLTMDSKADGAGIGADQMIIAVSDKRIGSSCYVFETDLYVSSESREGVLFHINMGQELFMLQFHKSEGFVYVEESSSSNSSNAFVYEIGRVASLDEWFNVRVEYYPAEKDSVRIKVYFDDKLAVISDNYYDHKGYKANGAEGEPGTKYNETKVTFFSDIWGTVYFDNIVSDRTNKKYSAEIDSRNPPLRNVDAPDGAQRIYGFEDEKYPEGAEATGSVSVADKDGGKALFVPAAGTSSIVIPGHERGSNANAVSFEADVIVSENTEKGAKLAIDFYSFGIKGKFMAGVHLVVSENAGGKYFTVSESLGSGTGSVIGDAEFALGESVRIRVDYFFELSTVAVYADGRLVGATLSTAIDSHTKYCAKVKLNNFTSVSSGGFYIDRLLAERTEIESFVEKDRVVHSFSNGYGEVEASSDVTLAGGNISFKSALAGGMIKIPTNERSEVKSSYIGTLGLVFGDGFYDGDELRVALCDREGAAVFAFDLVGQAGKISIYEVSERGRYPISIATLDALEALDIKYSKKLGVAILYADGVCVATTDTIYSADSLEKDYEVLKVTALCAGADVEISHAVAETSMQKFEVNIPETNPENESEILTFESSSSVDLPKAITATLVSSSAKSSVKELLGTAGRTKVYSFITTPGGKDYLNISSTARLESLGTAVFEAEMCIISNSSSSSAFEIEPLHGDTRAYKLTVTVKNNGDIAISGADIPSTVIAKRGEWFKLRLEYTNPDCDLTGDGKKDIIFRIFVNGSKEAVAVGYRPYTDTSFEAHEITSIRFFTWTDMDAEILLDNVYAGGNDSVYIPPEIPDEPEIEYPSEGEIGDGDYDGDAWTEQ